MVIGRWYHDAANCLWKVLNSGSQISVRLPPTRLVAGRRPAGQLLTLGANWNSLWERRMVSLSRVWAAPPLFPQHGIFFNKGTGPSPLSVFHRRFASLLSPFAFSQASHNQNKQRHLSFSDLSSSACVNIWHCFSDLQLFLIKQAWDFTSWPAMPLGRKRKKEKKKTPTQSQGSESQGRFWLEC